MPTCPKCIVDSLVGGSGYMSTGSELNLALLLNPTTSGVHGPARQVVFNGSLREGTVGEGEASYEGTLAGAYATDLDENARTSATIHTFSEGGALQFVQLVVRNDAGRIVLLANLEVGQTLDAPSADQDPPVGVPLAGPGFFSWANG